MMALLAYDMIEAKLFFYEGGPSVHEHGIGKHRKRYGIGSQWPSEN